MYDPELDPNITSLECFSTIKRPQHTYVEPEEPEVELVEKAHIDAFTQLQRMREAGELLAEFKKEYYDASFEK